MASKLDDQDGLSSEINLSDLPGCLRWFLFAWPPQDNDDDRASFLKNRLVARVLQVLNLGPASLRKKSIWCTYYRTKIEGHCVGRMVAR
ncbi:hypothetical protein IAS59_001326 [Cryptococcus gattii]